MASTRPTTSAGPRRRPPTRTAYEEFDPKSEWKDEPAANVLKVYLPEFEKNQIRVRFDQVTYALGVSAERRKGNNIIVRVNKEYKIPENSNVVDMKGKFEDGTLTITIAKEIASKVDPKLPEADKTMREPSGTQKPAEEKIPTPPSVPPPPVPPPSPKKQKPEVKPAKVPSLLPDPWREMEEGREFPDPSVLKGKAKAEFPKDEDENESQTPAGISTSLEDTKKPTGDRKSAKPDDDDDKEIASKWKESARLKDRFVEERKEHIPEKKFSWKGEKRGERKEYLSEQEMKESNDTPGSQELEMKAKEESKSLGPSGEESDIYAAAGKAMSDLAMRIKEDRQLVSNIGVAALVIVAIGSYISYTIGSSGKGNKN